MRDYFRPLLRYDLTRPAAALTLGGGKAWFSDAEVLRRGKAPEIVPVSDLPQAARDVLTRPRAEIMGLDMTRTHIMGILNVTPDSFSDGGEHLVPAQAVARARGMLGHGASLIDIGGESTKPGAITVPAEAEIARTEPVISALCAAFPVKVSIDTRKSVVARAALDAGALMVNDVSGFTHDPKLARLCLQRKVPVCVMHALGDPETMQISPRYDDVLLDVYDFLEAQVLMLENAGMARSSIVVDPGIGFGKTLDHNLMLLNRVSLFHSIGCPVLVGASRKRFIGTLSRVEAPRDRVMGSVAVALAAAAQGVQFLRVHDVRETREALDLWCALRDG